jgi:hypothetical protein
VVGLVDDRTQGASQWQPVIAISNSDEIFEGLELVPQYAPIRRLADNALVAVELQVRGRATPR